jgi:glycosyltransferase involved in cell wall biosynthesis
LADRSHILLVSYYFPPLGMGGVQRALKLAKYLPEFGWDVTVITPAHRAYHAGDESLVAELPESVNVHRVAVAEPARLFRPRGQGRPASGPPQASPPAWAKRVQQFARWPDDKVLFVKPAIRAARRLSRRRAFDSIWTTSPPPSVHRVGLNLSAGSRMIWLADFRDPWLVRLDDWGPTRWHERYAKILRRKIVAAADTVIAANDAISATLEPLQPKNPIEIIHNGYDESDFAQVEPGPGKSGELRILFYGTLAPIVDPSIAFHLLSEWRRRHPEIELSIEHVGVALGIDVVEIAQAHGLGDVFQSYGYLAHREAIGRLVSADLILIPLSMQAGLEATVPGRLFEALRSLRPILLTAHSENAASRLLEGIAGTWHIAPDTLTDGLSALDAVAALPPHQPVRSVESIQQFERREQARRVAEILNRLRNAKQESRT